MSQKVDTQQSDEYARESPLVPSAAIEKTWETWGAISQLSTSEKEKLQSSSADVIKSVYDFGKDLAPSTYEAAQLAPLMDELTSLDHARAESARQALQEYESKNPANSEYIRAFSSDIRKINFFLDHHWDIMADETITDSGAEYAPMERQYNNPWARQIKTIALRDVLELVSDTPNDVVKNPAGVNIESILIGASLAYNTLRNAGSVSEDQLLRTIYDVDSFYRPLLEIIGYDGFVMALKRETILIRMSRNAGEYDGITEKNLKLARKMLSELPPAAKMPGIIDDLISKLTLKDVESVSVLHDTSGHGIQFGTGTISEDDMLDFEDTVTEPVFDVIRDVWRVKSDTEVARKIAKQIEKDTENVKKNAEEKKIQIDVNTIHVPVRPVYDMVGVTVIIPSLDSLAYLFTLAAGRTVDANPIQPIYTHDRPTTAFHAKGEDVIQAVNINFGDISGGQQLDIKQSDNGHKVAKITLQFTPEGYDRPIPFEVQFQTKEQRIDARVGPAAHTFKQEGYKVPNIEDLKVLKSLSTLYKRRRRTAEGGPTELSLERAQALFPEKGITQKIKRALGAVSKDLSPRG